VLLDQLRPRAVDVLALAGPRLALGGELLGDLLVDGADRRAALLLLLGRHRLGQVLEAELLDLAEQRLVGDRLHELALGLAVAAARSFSCSSISGWAASRANSMPSMISASPHLVHLALDHHDRVLGAGDDHVHRALLALGEGRVGDQLAVDVADADAGERAVPHQVRDVIAADAPVIARTSVGCTLS
jgi:hypothetical protein